jgi:hypothetical protein
LYSTASAEEQWQALVGPWLRGQAVEAWRNPKPTVILTPSRAESFYLRSRLVEEGISFLGLRFWTPSDARKFLLTEIAPEIGSATQSEERLVARACAESLVQQASHDEASVISVIREPGPFLRAYDLLLGAGWDPAREGSAYGRGLARDMQRALEKFGIATQAGLHRQLRDKVSAGGESMLANLLVTGFNAAHWPLWDLLRAVVFSAEKSVVALSKPRVFAEDIDQLWISSWEDVIPTEALSPAAPTSSLIDDPPFASLVASYEKGSPGNAASAAMTFLVAPDLTTQIHAVVLQALDYLRSEACTRLGIVFAGANALALGVAAELRRLGVPLDDGTGMLMPGIFEKRCWKSWLALQAEPSVSNVIAWVRACESQGISHGAEEQLSAWEIADAVDGALAESLVDDLDFLARHLEQTSKGDRTGRVADFLRKRIVLPAEATFADFLALTRRALALRGWEEHLARLEIEPPTWLLKNKEVLSRRTFLEWLKEATDSLARTRGAEGNHFYGKVHLVIYAQMTGQTWSHLILTGLNEGVWPRVYEAGAFGSRHELMALNQQARALNRRGTVQGGQGMGHETVGADHGYCLLPLERRDLALRDLCAALEATATAACLTAMTTEGGRSLLPSDFFNHVYQAQTGLMLDEESFRRLAISTAAWCGRHAYLFKVSDCETRFPEIAATEIAYNARRDATQPFGPYEFSYAQPPRDPIQLTCKKWEDAWNHPASVWLEEVVGAFPWPEGRLSWQRAVGTWSHRWLALALREWQAKKSTPPELPLLIRVAADKEALGLRRRVREAKIELYPWWEQVWSQAQSVALGLAESLAPLLPDRTFLCEFRLPRNLMTSLPGTSQPDFLLNGRIDLLLFEPGSVSPVLDQNDFNGCACWVVDFKTGAAKNLNAKRIGGGMGLQAVLYTLAVRELGAESVSVSLHTPDAPLKQQVELDDVMETTAFFRSLDIMHRAGVFGMRADAENDYGYSPAYPMATRFVSATILDLKWLLVHGDVAVKEDE